MGWFSSKKEIKERYGLGSLGSMPMVIIDIERHSILFIESITKTHEMPLATITHASFQTNGFMEKSSLHFYSGNKVVHSLNSSNFSRDRVNAFIERFKKIVSERAGHGVSHSADRGSSFVDEIAKLKMMKDEGTISEEEFAAAKSRLLK
jgi:hypothetical protein